MERLTVKRKDGRWALANSADASNLSMMDKIPLAINRLAAYEDTGLTPNEIIEMEAEWCALKQLEAERRAERQEAEE